MKRPMTPRGHALLQEELRRLKAMRPENAKAIEAARAHGDISENADYDAAKDKSGMTEAKIREIEGILSQAEVIDPTQIASPQKIVFGTSVRVKDLDSDSEKTLHLYGSEESDVSRGWISFDSPLARALIGKEAGDLLTAELPGGVREYEVLEVFVDYCWP